MWAVKPSEKPLVIETSFRLRVIFDACNIYSDPHSETWRRATLEEIKEVLEECKLNRKYRGHRITEERVEEISKEGAEDEWDYPNLPDAD